LHIGLDVGPDGALIDRDGAPSDRLFAVGPLTRSAFWEIIAIPDIRSQCAELAARLVQDYGATITPTSPTQSPATVLVEPPIETAEISKYAKIIQAGAIA
jgi:uncharacterized NAD(P)/FAD-binding protein YdhS